MAIGSIPVVLRGPLGLVLRVLCTAWYQSKSYRANLHFRDNQFYLRDLPVYNKNRFPQPYLTDPAR